jgi:ATP-dependent RNA helicase RhlE
MDFQSLGLADIILSTLSTEGYTTPTPIQARAIPHVLAGKDVLGIAQTGTGKTAAFAIPIIQRLMTIPAPADQPKRARALILSPTRELATQIANSCRTYGANSGLTGTTIYGGVGQGGQVKALQRGVDIIVATPGRLLDLMSQGYVDLRGIQVFVLDEADRMLDMGFIKPIRDIIAQIPKARQSLLFSATMPGEIQGLADSMLRNPVRVEVAPPRATAANVSQALAYVPRNLKVGTLIRLLDDPALNRVIVFTKTKHGADKVAAKLFAAGIDSEAIHGNRNQNQRQRALNAFKTGRVRVLVATDVAARGLDVDDITHVINMDLPMEPEAYVHRIGRTGRAGASGISISFCDETERGLLRDIERLLGKKIPLARLDAVDAAQATEPPRTRGGPRDHNDFEADLANHIPVSEGWNQSSPRQTSRSQDGHTSNAGPRTPQRPARHPQRDDRPTKGHKAPQHASNTGTSQRFQPRAAAEFLPLIPDAETQPGHASRPSKGAKNTSPRQGQRPTKSGSDTNGYSGSSSGGRGGSKTGDASGGMIRRGGSAPSRETQGGQSDRPAQRPHRSGGKPNAKSRFGGQSRSH